MTGPLFLLLLTTTSLLHCQPLHAKSLPAGWAGGRGLDEGSARRLRRDLHDLLPSEAKMMSYPAGLGGMDNDLYYQPNQWRRRDLDQVMQQLMESDKRQEQEQEEEEAAYLATLLRLLSEAEHTRLVSPGDVEVVEEEEGEEDLGPEDFQGQPRQDYDETERVMMGKLPATWLNQIGQLLMQRLEPQLAHALLERARQEKLQQVGALAQRAGPELSRGIDQDTLRYLVARTLSSIGPNNLQMNYPSQRMKRDLSISTSGGETSSMSFAHRRTRRSLDDKSSPLPTSDPPLLRVKRLRLEEEEEERSPRQRMKRVDTTATGLVEELNTGSRGRRRRAVVNYDPRVLIHQILQYLQE